MNKQERVLNAIEGREVDRPPVCVWRHYGMQEPKETVNCHMKFYRETDMDLLKMMCDEFFVYPMGDAKTV